MTPEVSTTTSLNPFAPEYNPIQPGITPSPRRFFFYPPPSTANCLPPLSPSLPPPPFLPQHTLPYLPSYYAYNTSQHQGSITPPPPTTAVSVQYGRPGRGLTPRGRGFGRGRGVSWSDQRLCNLKFERRSLKTHEKNSVGFSKRSMHKDENRHKITPLKRDEEKTTVMIKNIPYACPRKELISMLDEFCLLENRKADVNEGTSIIKADHEQLITYAYDFLYLPIDFRTKKSRGFAFVNFTNFKAAWKFFDSFHLKKWDYVERLQWPKIIEIVSAKIQGKEDLVKHFSESLFECETDEFLPVRFTPARDGSGQRVEVTVVGKRLPVGSNHKA